MRNDAFEDMRVFDLVHEAWHLIGAQHYTAGGEGPQAPAARRFLAVGAFQDFARKLAAHLVAMV